MTFDNSKTIISLRIKMFAVTLLFFVYVALVYAAKIIKFPLLGLDDTIWTLILTVIYIVFLFFPMILNYQFVSFSDEGESIKFKFFNAGIVGGRKNSLEIKKNAFAGYKMESKYFGLSKSIILFQKLGQNIAKYPPVYISALSESQVSKLFGALNNYTPKT